MPHCSGSQLMNSFFHSYNNTLFNAFYLLATKQIGVLILNHGFQYNIKCGVLLQLKYSGNDWQFSFLVFYTYNHLQNISGQELSFFILKKSNCKRCVSVFNSQLYVKYVSQAIQISMRRYRDFNTKGFLSKM